MKKMIFGMVLSILIMSGTAFAAPVLVDFSVLGTNTLDISASNFPYLTLNGVSIYYDNFGSSADFAAADNLGIYGTTYGALVYNFNTPATELNFDFSVFNTTGPDPFALVTLFSYQGNFNDFVAVPGIYTPYDPANSTLGQITGALAYQGSVFDQAVSFFSPVSSDPNAPYIFTADHISYNPVPEPASLSLLGLGLAGLVFKRKKSSK